MKQPKPGLMLDEAGLTFCRWRAAMPDYHDHEWGYPVADDQALFEKICLEGFQSGMAWITILRKRENFRQAFANFDFERIARYTQRDVERLMGDAGIVRNQRKIFAAINNAQRACELVDECGSLASWLWRFEPDAKSRPKKITLDYLNAHSQPEMAVRLSKELKRRGWSFVGPTTLYAFMQAVGFVNDHIAGCVCREAVETARGRFVRP